jgi:hypothetical protein
MPEPAGRPAKPCSENNGALLQGKPPRTWRPMVLWTTGILLALGVAWFVTTLAVPFLQVRKVVHGGDPSRLGSPHEPVRKIDIYLKVAKLVPGENYRRTAVENLRFGHEEAVPILIALLADKEMAVRFDAAIALGSIGREAPDGGEAPETVPALVKTLKDPDWHVLQDKNECIREAARKALEKIRTEAGRVPAR